jgi:hypothetical protein
VAAQIEVREEMLRRVLVVVGVLLIFVILMEEAVLVGEGDAGGVYISYEALTLLLGVILGLVVVFFIFRKPPTGRRKRRRK